MTTPPVRVGLVGCGRLAEAGYLPAFAATEHARLVAVADPDAARRDHVAGLAGLAGAVLAFPDARSLLDAVDLDAVVIASPARHHVDDAALAVAAGAAVLVEKPPAPDLDGAARLAALGPRVRVGFNRRFDPAVAAVREAVPVDGGLELDLLLHYRRAGWGAHQVTDDVVLDLAPHLFDLARWVSSSEILDVRTLRLAPDRAEFVATLERGTARVRVRADTVHAERVVVRDHRSAVLAAHRVGGLLGAVRGRLTGRGGPHPLAASLAAQLDAFAGTVPDGEHPTLGTTADGVAVMAAVEAAVAGGPLDSPVPIPDAGGVPRC